MLVIWLSLALAAPPTKVAAKVSVGGGEVGRLQASTDNGVITGVTEGGDLVLLDTSSWRAVRTDTENLNVAASSCTARSSVAVPDEELGWLVYVGCTNGDVQTWRWTGSRITPYGSDDAPDGLVTNTGSASVVALFDLDGDGLWALTKTSSAMGALRLTTTNGVVAVDTSVTQPVTFLPDFDQAVVHRLGSNPIVSLYDGDGRFSQWRPKTGELVAPIPVGPAINATDIVASTTTTIYFVERGAGRMGQYIINGGVGTLTYLGAALSAPRTLLLTQNDGEPRFYVEDSTALKVFPAGGAGSPVSQFSVGFDGVDFVEGPSGYSVIGTTTGEFAVLTANPWLADMALSPSTTTTESTVTVTFTSDVAGTWTLDLDGTRTTEGTRLGTGEVTTAGEVTVSFEVDDTFTDGDHLIWARITDASGEKGSASATLVIDDVPTEITLDAEAVGVGNRQVVLSWSKLSDVDLTGYNVYVSDAPFEATDYVSGGPEGKVGANTSPVFVEQPLLGAEVRVSIDRLVNGRTYWLAVRATDGSNEGPMSNVVSATPIPTCSASECGDEMGGPPCSTLPGVTAGWSLALLGIAAVRRRRGVLGAAVMVGVLGAGIPSAQAQEGAAGTFKKDETPAWVNFEVQFGGFQYSDTLLKSAYGNSGTLARLEVGLQIFRYGELDVGVGYLWDKGNTLSTGGLATAEEARTEWMPLTLTATLRAHVMDEQPLVPYASIGMSYIFFREAPLNSEGAYRDARMVTGSKLGWHWGVGGNILLDVFQPRRASILEARTGINDTWLTLEYREQRLDPNGGLDLSGWTIGGGLKIDY